MAIHRLSQVIDRPIGEATITDGAAFASWNPTIRLSRPLDTGAPRPGTVFEWELREFGMVRQRLDECDVDRRVRIVPDLR